MDDCQKDIQTFLVLKNVELELRVHLKKTTTKNDTLIWKHSLK